MEQQYDLIVCGLGGAGAVAALEAQDHGLNVLVLERFLGGGATAISGGVVYAGGGTKIQDEAGIEDSVQNMQTYLRHEVGDAVSESTLQQFCENSARNLEWLQSKGVPFRAALCPKKTSYPNNDYYLYYSGNESFEPYNTDSRPAPRGHRADGPGVSGAALFEPLRRAVQDSECEVRLQARVSDLIEEKGRIVGVQYTEIPHGTFAARVHAFCSLALIRLRYVSIYLSVLVKLLEFVIERAEQKAVLKTARANRGVVLATGGYYFNQAMVQQYAPKFQKGMPLGTIGDDGSGMRMGQKVGGKLDRMDRVSAWRFVNPPQAFVRGIMVNAAGQRFSNEMLYGDTVGARMMAQDEPGRAWLIIDQPIWRKALGQLSLKDNLWFQSLSGYMYLFLERKKAHSIQQLAGKIGIDARVLQEQVDAYNSIESEDPMGKPVEFCTQISRGPYYALNISYDSLWVPCPSLSLGGLRVDESSGLVLNAEDSPIDGLYAIGRTAVGLPSNGYVSGLSIADCVFSGLRAARHAASADAQD